MRCALLRRVRAVFTFTLNARPDRGVGAHREVFYGSRAFIYTYIIIQDIYSK